MARISKERIRANRFRELVAELLQEPDWIEDGVQYWLNKELQREPDYIYSENEHAALLRIIAAGTLFDGWDGYSVAELRVAAGSYKRDGGEEDEKILEEYESKKVTQLRLKQMGHLVGYCRNVAGLPLSPFRPDIKILNDLE